MAALTPVTAFAEIQCSPTHSPGVEICNVGIHSSHWQRAQQSSRNWCWAACISGIFNFHGYRVAQERIVADVYGGAVDLPAYGPQIAEATTGQWMTDDGKKRFYATCEVLTDAQFYFNRPDASQQTAWALRNNSPLIIGTGNHAMVLTAMTYNHDQFGNFRLLNLTVRDPLPGKGRRFLSQQEVMGVQFLAKINI